MVSFQSRPSTSFEINNYLLKTISKFVYLYVISMNFEFIKRILFKQNLL